MEELRLPWTTKEGILFGCIIAFLSSMLIGGYNIYDNLGYDLEHFEGFVSDFIIPWPIMFAIAFVLSNTIVGWVSRKVVPIFMSPTDSTNTYICFNLIVCVFQMSVLMTFLGGLVGESIGHIMGGPAVDITALAENWVRIWPRNFCIAFWVEMLVAQPAARRAMVMIHKRKLAATGGA